MNKLSFEPIFGRFGSFHIVKVTKEEMAAVKHHVIDFLNPLEKCTVVDFRNKVVLFTSIHVRIPFLLLSQAAINFRRFR